MYIKCKAAFRSCPLNLPGLSNATSPHTEVGLCRLPLRGERCPEEGGTGVGGSGGKVWEVSPQSLECGQAAPTPPPTPPRQNASGSPVFEARPQQREQSLAALFDCAARAVEGWSALRQASPPPLEPRTRPPSPLGDASRLRCGQSPSLSSTCLRFGGKRA